MQSQWNGINGRRARWLLGALAGGFLAGVLSSGGAGTAAAAPQERSRTVRQYWKAGPLGRYVYPALLWSFDERDRGERRRPPGILRDVPGDVLAPPLGSFDGQFLDADTGKPIPEVEAIITRGDEEPGVVLTDGRGRFSGEDVPAGEYSIASHAAGYYDQKIPVTVAPGKTNVVRLRLRPRPAAFAGHLRATTGEGMGGVRLILKDGDGKTVKEMDTLADGSFGMGGLKAGQYTLEFALGRTTGRRRFELKPGDIETIDLEAK